MLLQKVGQFEHNGPLSLSIYICVHSFLILVLYWYKQGYLVESLDFVTF